MRTSLALLAIAVAALGPAAAASAKEIASVKICGADGCHDVTDRATHTAVDGGPPTTAPEAATPFYRVEVTVKAEGGMVPGWSFLWVPAAEKTTADDGTWMNPASTTIDALKLLARDIEPLPASELVLPEPVPAETPAAAPAPAAPPDGGGMPAAVWAFIAAGGLGLAFALARGGAALAARRRGGAAPAR